MPGGFPLIQSLSPGTDFGTDLVTNSDGTTVAPSATANTKGAYVQFAASTAFDSSIVILSLNTQGSLGNSLSFDLALGAAASEKIIAADLILSATSAGGQRPSEFALPLAIPSGSAISLRAQSASASDPGGRVNLQIFGGAYGAPLYAGIEAVGFNSAT